MSEFLVLTNCAPVRLVCFVEHPSVCSGRGGLLELIPAVFVEWNYYCIVEILKVR